MCLSSILTGQVWVLIITFPELTSLALWQEQHQHVIRKRQVTALNVNQLIKL